MQKRQWLRTAIGLVVIPVWILTAQAQDGVKPGRGVGSFQSRMERAVGLTPEQRETVRGLLAQQSEDLRALRESVDPKYAAVREQTDAKIRALLNPEQQKKFEVFLAKQKQARASRSRRTS